MFDIIQLMEEFKQEQSSLTEQGQHTLLSYQMLKINSYITEKCLIQSIKIKNDSDSFLIPNFSQLIIPFVTLTTMFEINSRKNDNGIANSAITIDKTLKKGKKQNLQQDRRSLNKKTTKVRNRNSAQVQKKKKRQNKYRFLKVIKRQHTKDRLLFQQNILSIRDINGVGYILLPQGRILQGQFVDGFPIGKLRIKFQNGIVYHGPVYNFRPHGMGQMVLANGERYIGQFCYGQPHGEGVHYLVDGKVKREGEWKHGKYIK